MASVYCGGRDSASWRRSMIQICANTSHSSFESTARSSLPFPDQLRSSFSHRWCMGLFSLSALHEHLALAPSPSQPVSPSAGFLQNKARLFAIYTRYPFSGLANLIFTLIVEVYMVISIRCGMITIVFNGKLVNRQ